MLNGGSSSGTTSIARCLQSVLTEPWVHWGVDDLLDALPPSLQDSADGAAFGSQGEVVLGEGFRAIEAAWLAGLAAMARAGARMVLDDVFLGGAASQARTRAALDGLTVLWVGVHCDAQVAAEREATRGDRAPGMAASQADVVHQGVHYDVEVDTTSTQARDCARVIAACVS